MKSRLLICSLLLALPWARTGFAKPKNAGATYSLKYVGGSLPLSHHKKLRATVAEDSVVLRQGHRRVAVPAASITEITQAGETGANAGLYVALEWAGNAPAGGQARRVEAVFETGSLERSAFLTALQRVTGKRAVNTDAVPTVVRYYSR
jgi:hypothetical protein